MKFVQYKGASSGWYFVCPVLGYNGHNKEIGELLLEMGEWCKSTFGADTMGYAARPTDTWSTGFNDFMFKHENDAVMFVLRWKGEF